MLTSLSVNNFTVFSEATLEFGRHLNVIVGENDVGKTHVLKLAYSVLAVGWEEGRGSSAERPTKSALKIKLAEKLVKVFRPDALGRLAKRKRGNTRCIVALGFRDEALNISFALSTGSKSEVVVDRLPTTWSDSAPAYLPTRELLTIFPGFISVYENHYLEFEETWRDTCILLGAPLKRGAKEARVRELLAPLEAAMGGTIVLDKQGRFYFENASGSMEVPLVAEGLRKLGMLARLIATGALLDKGTLFWDEPEANLNPRMIKRVARSIFELSRGGIQVFIATHSLFLLRELHILQVTADQRLDIKYFGLHRGETGVEVLQGHDMADVGDIAALDEDLEQSERYINAELGVVAGTVSSKREETP